MTTSSRCLKPGAQPCVGRDRTGGTNLLQPWPSPPSRTGHHFGRCRIVRLYLQWPSPSPQPGHRAQAGAAVAAADPGSLCVLIPHSGYTPC